MTHKIPTNNLVKNKNLNAGQKHQTLKPKYKKRTKKRQQGVKSIAADVTIL